MALERQEISSITRDTHGLIPNEVQYRLGCVGCTAEGTGCFSVTGPRTDREDLVATLLAASEIANVPVDVMTGQGLQQGGQDRVIDDCDGTQACADPAMMELFTLGVEFKKRSNY